MMRALLLLLMMLYPMVCPNGVSAEQSEQRRLTGQVFQAERTAGNKLAAGAAVWIVGVGNVYTTGPDGEYRLFIPDAIQFGQTIRLHVKKSGWGIDKPEGGKFELPRELAKDIFVLPESSSDFLSASHIDEFLESLPELTKTQVKPDGRWEEVDMTLVVKGYAAEHHLSYQQTLRTVEKRVKFYEETHGRRQLCLAAVYRKDLQRINNLCKARNTEKLEQLPKKRQELQELSRDATKSRLQEDDFFRLVVLRKTFTAPQKLLVGSEELKSKQSKLNEAKRELLQLIEEVVGDFRLAGDAYYVNYEFTKALRTYQEGLGYVTREEIPTLWADMQMLVGNANGKIGDRSEGPAIHQHLDAALGAYKQSLLVYRKDQFPQAWAMVQNNLAITLMEQGIRTDGEEGRKLLAQAVAAYKAALQILTRDLLPHHWATTQSNFGVALREQGVRTGGEEGHQLLAQANAAHRAALQLQTREHLPQDWARTQNNLGNTFREQGIRTGGEEGRQLLAQAVAAYRAALEVRTRDLLPQQWAATQNNLGVTLSEQGIRVGGQEGQRLLAEAIIAYKAALEVRIRKRLPQQWAETQNNLGNTLHEQGIRVGGQEGQRLLAEAITAYKAALEVRTRERLPQDWAITQQNLGAALSEQGIRLGGQEGQRLLVEAITAYKAALQVLTREHLPQYWAQTSSNLAEDLFLSGQFAQARDQLAMLLQYSKLDSPTRVALLALEVANFAALNAPEEIRQSFKTLRQALDQQTPDFSLTWSFKTIELFIQQDRVFDAHKQWLLELIKGIDNKQRDEMLAAIDAARKAFLEAGKS
jgi:tetratricopeptide (TPR) repeat protein